MEDEIPLIEKKVSKRSGGGSGATSGVEKKKRPDFPPEYLHQHEVKIDDSLQSLSLLYGCTIAELKATNNLFNDGDLHTKLTLQVPNRQHVPVDKLIDLGTPTATGTPSKNDSETSSTGDVEVATQKLFDRIDLSNKDLQSRVSSIGAATEGLEPSDEDHRREADNKLSEFLGNLPPVAVLPSIKNMQKENEDNWCYLGLCVGISLLVVPCLVYYYYVHVIGGHLSFDP